jgi:hypothetical protein
MLLLLLWYFFLLLLSFSCCFFVAVFAVVVVWVIAVVEAVFVALLHFVLLNAQIRECSDVGKQLNTKQNPTKQQPGNTKGGSITVLLTSCLTGLD